MTTPVRRAVVLAVALALPVPFPPVAVAGTEAGWLELELAGPDDLEDAPLLAQVIAEPLGRAASGDAALPEERRFEVAWPAVHRLPLEPGVLWRIRIAVDGFWAPSVTVEVKDDSTLARQRLELTRTGLIRGRIDGIVDPGAVTLELRVRRHEHREDGRRVKGPDDVRVWQPASCAADPDEDRIVFECRPPVGRADLRLSVAGAVPHYVWDVDVQRRRPLVLPPLQLRPGASVVGWVQRSPRPAGPGGGAPVTVRLEPEVMRTGAANSEDRIGATSIEATADGEGFFQLQGAPPGAYGVVAVAPGYAPLRIPVRLAEGRETVIRDDLVLRPPVSVELRIDPPLDPYGRRWRWELLSSSPQQGRLEEAGRGQVDVLGTVRLEDLVPGPHLLTIEDQDGSRWLGREIEIEPAQESLDVTLDVVALEGTVLLGDEPMSTRVIFGATQALTALRFESDDEGRFFGYLPRPGTWKVEVQNPRDGTLLAAEEVEVDPRDDVAEVVLRLPDTHVEGRVVDEDGNPVPHARLITMDSTERRWGSQSQTDDNGAFVLRGLEPASYLLQVRSASAASGWEPVRVEEGRPVRNLSIVLRDMVLLGGRLTGGGVPVPGADVQAVPQRRSIEPQWVERGLTGPDGHFRIELPADTVVADLLVSPPGLPFLARRFVLEGPSTQVELEVDPRGGRLELVGVTSAPGEPPKAVLLVGEIPVHLEQLRGRWRQGEGGSLVLVEMEPTSYALCSVAPAGGTSPSSAADLPCVGGLLPPLGQLRLDLVSATHPPEVP